MPSGLPSWQRDQFGNWKFTAGWWLTVQTCRLEANQGGDAATSALPCGSLMQTTASRDVSAHWRCPGREVWNLEGTACMVPHLAPNWGLGEEPRAAEAILGFFMSGGPERGGGNANGMGTLGGLFCFCVWKTGISKEQRWL